MRSRPSSRPVRLAVAALAAAALTGTAAATASATADSGTGATRDGFGQACGTNDLTFKVSEETQAGGYFLVTAKAKPGITCYLKGTFPSAAFGSAPEAHVSPLEQAVTGTIKLSGSTAAYAGISPKSTNSDDGREYGQLIVAVAGYETQAVAFSLAEPVLVDKPVATNWHADPDDAVPYVG
ncbi:hypothetical protein GCM10010129_43740 [Streptomyces fumigatiscleroticus]|nr:hypothetical protein GCM10010129_43740 [Streptomyces fumigatiscleroticus]